MQAFYHINKKNSKNGIFFIKNMQNKVQIKQIKIKDEYRYSKIKIKQKIAKKIKIR